MNNIIAILAAGIKQDINGNWMSSDFSQDDILKSAPGGELRIFAGYYLYQDNPIKILVMGGIGSDKNIEGIEYPIISNVLKSELIALGIKEDDILEESNSINTYTQLKELINFMKNYNIDHANIISNDYHIPRIKAMIENIHELKEFFNKNNFDLISAENICIEHDAKRWEKIIEEAYNSELMKRRMELEEKGISELINGEYKL